MPETGRPLIVVKRVKRAGHGHHGGAWKVAFADFVTAMMAFFLLMWLVGSTTPAQKRAISDFFHNPSAIAGPGGASTSMIKLGGTLDLAPKSIRPEHSLVPPRPALPAAHPDSRPKPTAESAEARDRAHLRSLLATLARTIEGSRELARFKDQLLIGITRDGLRIQIVDHKNRPMFRLGSAHLMGYTRTILDQIAKVIDEVPNRISIAGHTDAKAYANRRGYGNWELSTERANAARRELVRGGMNPAKVARIVGLGSSVPFDRAHPDAPVNRRISINVLTRKAARAIADTNAQAARPASGLAAAPRLEEIAPGHQVDPVAQ